METLSSDVQNYLHNIRDSSSPEPLPHSCHRDHKGRRHAVSADLDRFDVASLGFDMRGRSAAELEEVFETMVHRATASSVLLPSAVVDFASSVRKMYSQRQHNRDDAGPDATPPPYHNFEHAFDVTQACFAMLSSTSAGTLLDASGRAALLVAALCHDVGHGGRTNGFLAATDDPLSRRFGATGTLELFHTTLATRLLDDEQEAGILSDLEPREAAEFVATVGQLIEATDMSRHAAVLREAVSHKDTFAAHAADSEPLQRGPARIALMKMLLKVADISNVARPMQLSRIWAERLKREFNAQAAEERAQGLPVSPGMEPETTSKMVVGFIDYVAGAAFEALADVVPGSASVRDAVSANRAAWEALG